jgi:hypothetical protein
MDWAVQAGDRLVIAIDGETVRGAKNKEKMPHLVAALAHGIGAEDRKPPSLGEGRPLPGRQIAGQDGKTRPA